MPSNVKELQSFLGLARYYLQFVKDYALIATPLNDLTCKDDFSCSPLAQEPFDKLKIALTMTLVLALPNFDLEFHIETDASSFSMAIVLS